MDNKSTMNKYSGKEDKRSMPVFVKYGLIAFAALIIIAGVVWFTLGQKSYVATVGSEKIGEGEYKFYLTQQKSTMLQQAQAADPTMDENTFWTTKISGDQTALDLAKENTLNGLKELKILLIKAKEKNITLDKSELKAIDDSINNLVKSKFNGSVNEANKKLKEEYGITIDDYRQMYKDYTLVNKFVEKEKASFKVSKDSLKTYYEKHPDWFKTSQFRTDGGEALWARHILIKASKTAKKEVIEAARKKAEAILQKAKSGADFATLAKENSEDSNAKNGGEYVFGKGSMVKEFENAAFSLSPGQIYDKLVQTEFGFHIIKLEEKYAKGEPVSLKCAQEYNEYGISFVEDKLYKEESNKWMNDKKYNLVKNKSVYGAIK